MGSYREYALSLGLLIVLTVGAIVLGAVRGYLFTTVYANVSNQTTSAVYILVSSLQLYARRRRRRKRKSKEDPLSHFLLDDGEGQSPPGLGFDFAEDASGKHGVASSGENKMGLSHCSASLKDDNCGEASISPVANEGEPCSSIPAPERGAAHDGNARPVSVARSDVAVMNTPWWSLPLIGFLNAAGNFAATIGQPHTRGETQSLVSLAGIPIVLLFSW